MKYYIKKLGSQELGSVKGDTAQRGRYIYISKDDEVLDFFPPLSKIVKNDSSVLPIIPLYTDEPEKVYCNFVYHNDKFSDPQYGTRNEYRIYSNNSLEENHHLFQKDDILIFRGEQASSLEDFADTNQRNLPETATAESKVYFLYRCTARDASTLSLPRFFGDKEVVQSADIIEYRRVAGYAASC